MIFYSDKNVLEASKERIRFLFKEFPNHRLVVSFSGGKDSTVLLYVVKEVMDELGIEKIPVMFLDQEIEAPDTVEYMRHIMSLDFVEPYWIQTYFKKWNANAGEYFNCWGEGEKWIRDKEPNSYCDVEKLKGSCEDNDNCYALAAEGVIPNCISLTGVRIDESPTRRQAFLYNPIYKDITWCNRQGSSYAFCPLYDWNTKDIWKYIFDNKLKYNKLYNYYFTSKSLNTMRVAAFLNEQSIQTLSQIKEIYPAFFDALLKRVPGINTTNQSLAQLLDYVKENGLSKYFATWDEYVDYLCDKLMPNVKVREKMRKFYYSFKKSHLRELPEDSDLYKQIENEIGITFVGCLLYEDHDCKRLSKKHLGIFIKIQKYAGPKKSDQGEV